MLPVSTPFPLTQWTLRFTHRERRFTNLPVSHSSHQNQGPPHLKAASLTDAAETLRQSSPQLFHFTDFFRGLRGRHQVAHVAVNKQKVKESFWKWPTVAVWDAGFFVDIFSSRCQAQETCLAQLSHRRISIWCRVTCPRASSLEQDRSPGVLHSAGGKKRKTRIEAWPWMETVATGSDRFLPDRYVDVTFGILFYWWRRE